MPYNSRLSERCVGLIQSALFEPRSSCHHLLKGVGVSAAGRYLSILCSALTLAVIGSGFQYQQSGASTASATGRTSLVDETTASQVLANIFPLWQQYLHDGDVKGLRSIETGIQLDWDLQNCATTSYELHTSCEDSPMMGQAVIVPRQFSYPVRFLAEVQTTEESQAMSPDAPNENTPALELIVLTKASSTAPWRISFETGLYSTTSSPPPFLPAPLSVDGTVPAVSPHVIKSVRSLPTQLADYWQSWKVHGHAPEGSTFVPGPFTTSLGAYLATGPDGVVGPNLRQNVLYSSNPSVDGLFVFPVAFGEFTSNPTPNDTGYSGTSGTLVCSSIRVSIDFTPDAGGPPLVQRKSLVDFGPGLAPGRYSSVLDESVHNSCVLTNGQNLSALGADGDVFSQVGTHQSKPD